MKTILYEEIDGIQVITGFGEPVIDPYATRPAVSAALHETTEFLAMKAKMDEGLSHTEAAQVAYNAAMQSLRDEQAALKEGRTSEATQHKAVSDVKSAEYRRAKESVAICQAELKPLARAVAAKKKELIVDLAVYFEPRQGEILEDPAAVDLLAGQLSELAATGQLLDMDGNVVEDNRGIGYWLKTGSTWSHHTIFKIGESVPAAGILPEALTATQRDEIEAQRVSDMSTTDRATEKAQALDIAIKAAASMRSELEIKADPEALAKSQAAYQDDVAAIEAKYGS